VAELQLVGGKAAPSFAELVACVDREIGFRAKVYKRWVEQGKLTATQAELELVRMRAVRARLVRAEAERTILGAVAIKHAIAHRHLQSMVEESENLLLSQVGEAP